MTDYMDYYKGVTHCQPHGNQMPCATCGENLIEHLQENE